MIVENHCSAICLQWGSYPQDFAASFSDKRTLYLFMEVFMKIRMLCASLALTGAMFAGMLFSPAAMAAPATHIYAPHHGGGGIDDSYNGALNGNLDDDLDNNNIDIF